MYTGKTLGAIEFLSKLDKDSIVQVKEVIENRSMRQNRLLWAYYTNICAEFKERGIFISQNDLHEGLKEKLLKTTYKKNKFTGRRYKQEKTTTTLNKKEFSQYLKDIDSYLYQMFEIIVLKPTELLEYTG